MGNWVTLALPGQLTDSCQLYLQGLQTWVVLASSLPTLREDHGAAGLLLQSRDWEQPSCDDSWATSSKGRKQQGKKQNQSQKGSFWVRIFYIYDHQLARAHFETVWLCCCKASSWIKHKLLNSSSWSRNRQISLSSARGKNLAQRQSYLYGKMLRRSCSNSKRS